LELRCQSARPHSYAPTEEITATGQELVVDGVRVIFQLTPETEAPAEMNFYFPDLKALCMAENCSHTMHNLVPIRGALVRNALNWSKYINESLQMFGGEAQVLFASHNWPRWGGDDLREFLVLQRRSLQVDARPDDALCESRVHAAGDCRDAQVA